MSSLTKLMAVTAAAALLVPAAFAQTGSPAGGVKKGTATTAHSAKRTSLVKAAGKKVAGKQATEKKATGKKIAKGVKSSKKA